MVTEAAELKCDGNVPSEPSTSDERIEKTTPAE